MVGADGCEVRVNGSGRVGERQVSNEVRDGCRRGGQRGGESGFGKTSGMQPLRWRRFDG